MDDDGAFVVDDAAKDVGVGLVFVDRCAFAPAKSMTARQHARTVRAMFQSASEATSNLLVILVTT